MAFVAGLTKKVITFYQNGAPQALTVKLAPPSVEWRRKFYSAVQLENEEEKAKALAEALSAESIAPFIKEWDALDCDGAAIPCTTELVTQICKMEGMDELLGGLGSAVIDSIMFLTRGNFKPSADTASTTEGGEPAKPASN